jgi:hypothetical protein
VLDHLVRQLVADVLELLDAVHARIEAVVALEEVDQQERALVRVVGRALEAVEEDVVLGEDGEHGVSRSNPRGRLGTGERSRTSFKERRSTRVRCPRAT